MRKYNSKHTRHYSMAVGLERAITSTLAKRLVEIEDYYILNGTSAPKPEFPEMVCPRPVPVSVRRGSTRVRFRNVSLQNLAKPYNAKVEGILGTLIGKE